MSEREGQWENKTERERGGERTGVAVSSAPGFQPALPLPPPHWSYRYDDMCKSVRAVSLVFPPLSPPPPALPSGSVVTVSKLWVAHTLYSLFLISLPLKQPTLLPRRSADIFWSQSGRQLKQALLDFNFQGEGAGWPSRRTFLSWISFPVLRWRWEIMKRIH